MIKNQKQVIITKNILIKLYEAKSIYEAKRNELQHLEYELFINSIAGLIEDLEEQIQTYKLRNYEVYNPIE
jgi:hypothetical protein